MWIAALEQGLECDVPYLQQVFWALKKHRSYIISWVLHLVQGPIKFRLTGKAGGEPLTTSQGKSVYKHLLSSFYFHDLGLSALEITCPANVSSVTHAEKAWTNSVRSIWVWEWFVTG